MTEYKQLTPREEMVCKLLLLIWLIGFCAIMSAPIWLNALFGVGVLGGMLVLIFGFAIWMFMLMVVVM